MWKKERGYVDIYVRPVINIRMRNADEAFMINLVLGTILPSFNPQIWDWITYFLIVYVT